MNYVFSTEIDQPINAAIDTLTDALKKHHLGIVSDVNVAAIVKNKLDQAMPAYRILGACNPGMAKTMIDEVPEVGVLLPCTIVAREAAGKTIIDFMDPIAVLGLAHSETVEKVARDAEQRLRAVISDLEQP